MLYEFLNANPGFYRCPVEHESRSRMNVVFRVGEFGGDDILEKRFIDMASAAKIAGTPGHRSVGGIRVSLYNAVTLEWVKTLIEFMSEFRRTQG
jgi:phosphoserine aminotransferase